MFECSFSIMHVSEQSNMSSINKFLVFPALTIDQKAVRLAKTTGYKYANNHKKFFFQAVRVVSPSSSLVLVPFATRAFPGTTWRRRELFIPNNFEVYEGHVINTSGVHFSAEEFGFRSHLLCCRKCDRFHGAAHLKWLICQ